MYLFKLESSFSPLLLGLCLTSYSCGVIKTKWTDRSDDYNENNIVSADDLVPQLVGESTLFLGDSITTGAFAHPKTTISYLEIAKKAAASDPYEVSSSEASLFVDWKLSDPLGIPHKFRGDASSDPISAAMGDATISVQQIIETNEYTWANLVAEYQNIEPDHRLNFAQNGKRIEHATDQIEAALAKPNVLPKQVFIFFTGNDLCREGGSTSTEMYRNELKAALDKLTTYGDEQASSNVYIVKHLPMVQNVLKESVQSKVVTYKTPSYDGTEISCSELYKRDGTSATDDDGNVLEEARERAESSVVNADYTPATLCGTVLKSIGNPEAMGKFAKQVDEYNGAIDEVAAMEFKKLKVRVVGSTESIDFEAEDIANDCFHLGLPGQAKVAKSVVENL